MSTYTETSHFVSFGAAYRYYLPYGYSAKDVERKIKEGDISVGKPTLKAGQRLMINRLEERYVIVD